MGASDRGTAYPRISGPAERGTNARRVRTSMFVTFTTLTFTNPVPKRRCGTTVQACHGS
jgi:hypothetical protein